MHKHLRFLLAVICVAIATANLNAGLVTFDFAITTSGAANLAGSDLDDVADGLTGTTTVTTSDGNVITLTATPNGGRFNRTGTSGDSSLNFGINASGGDDDSDAFDGGEGPESMTFSFTSSSPATIEFVSIDFDRLGTDDVATLAFAGGSDFSINNSAADGSDLFTLATEESLSQGQSITLAHEAGGGFGLEQIKLNVTTSTAVPEPSSLLMFGTALVSILMPRKRRR
jgi:hypothetical protein